MELIRINESKLKIMLDSDDVKKYDLDPDGASCDDTETRAAFWEILDLAKRECGFDAARERVFIQLYPSRCGGCEMYVTKLPREEGEEEKRGAPRKRGTDGMLIASKGREVAYVFDDRASLVSACRYLAGVGFLSESAAYESPAGALAITFVERERSNSRRYLPRCGEYAPLDEYGRRHASPIEVAYIKEYMTCVIRSGAVEKLASR